MKRSLTWVLGVTLIASGTVHAEGVVVDRSEIAFTMKQLGVKFDGRFKKWTADIVFQPKALAGSRADIDVDLASIDLASTDSETEARDALWFNTPKFPIAHFVSTSFRDLGGNRYEVIGNLSMKGMTHDCVVPLTVRTDAAGNRIAEGSFSLKRLDYRIGEGEWADTGLIANDVAVRVRIVLPPET